VTFLPKYYLENIKRIIEPLKFKTLKIVHIAEDLPISSKDAQKNGIFIDVGDQMTQIIGVKNGQLCQVAEFQGGGKAFVQSLSQRLGINENRAREMTERYLKKDLEPDTLERLKEIFSWERKIWYDNLKDKLDKLNLKSCTIFLFGGASSLPEIQSVLEENSLEAKFISIKDFECVKDAAKILDDPQYIPALLISHTYG
jgi:Ethanolamine utilization protein EutJ (predicted chaperonin)